MCIYRMSVPYSLLLLVADKDRQHFIATITQLSMSSNRLESLTRRIFAGSLSSQKLSDTFGRGRNLFKRLPLNYV
jgi:hypothetical protein